MEYVYWMNVVNNMISGCDLFSQEEMEYIEVYFYDLVNNFLVFVVKDFSSWQYGNCQVGKYVYCGNMDWMKEMYKKIYFV